MTINPSFVKKLVGGVNLVGEAKLNVLLRARLPMYSVQSVMVYPLSVMLLLSRG